MQTLIRILSPIARERGTVTMPLLRRHVAKLSSLAGLMTMTFTVALVGATTPVAAENLTSGSICLNTAKLVAYACLHDSSDDYLMDKAICGNILAAEQRSDCYEAADEERDEAVELCKEQRSARQSLCQQLEENAYDPSGFWLASNFVDPLQIGASVPINPYMPLLPGTRVLAGDDETVTVTVTGDTKLINGVTCVTVRDVAEEDGVVLEDTDDWMAQDIHGAVWYCGEISQNFELYDGDNPAEPELVDVDGSWKAFRDGALPGVLMLANPVAGQTYRQEMALGDAEDAAQILHTSADGLLPGDECEDDEIAEFVDDMCAADCLVTRDFTPIEPDGEEHKYYARNVGLILEVGGDSCTVLDED